MGIMDAFKPEDRTEVTYSNFYNLIKQAAQYEIVMNAVNCNVPHRYIREAMTGEKEEEVAEMAQTAEGISMKFYEKEQLPAEPIKSGDFPLKAISLTPEAAATGQGIIYPTEQESARSRKQRRKERRTMAKMNLKFRDFLTLLSPAQHITVQDEDNPLKQGESDTIFKGKAAKARREEGLADREVKMIAPTGDPDLPGTYVFKIWLYK